MPRGEDSGLKSSLRQRSILLVERLPHNVLIGVLIGAWPPFTFPLKIYHRGRRPSMCGEWGLEGTWGLRPEQRIVHLLQILLVQFSRFCLQPQS